MGIGPCRGHQKDDGLVNPQILSQLGEQCSALGRIVDSMRAILDEIDECKALCPELKSAMKELKWAETAATICLHDAARQCSVCNGNKDVCRQSR